MLSIRIPSVSSVGRLFCFWGRLAAALASLFLGVGLASAADVTFEQHVRPILKAYCFDCHGGGEQLEGNLDLRLKRFLLRGGESGPALKTDDAPASLVLRRIKSGEMPPTEKKVPADQIALVERWIATGAKTLRDEPESLPPGIDITPEERAFWSFQPLGRVEPPQLSGTVTDETALTGQPEADLIRTPIDAFILARLRENGLRFSPEADRLALLRRASFDLTGLPPSPAEIAEFLEDTSANAYEKVLDRLLQSPHYGERWGRHWLDVAGYAESEGNGNEDSPRPYAYKYRDYVIRSLNADKPFDQFIMEQLAGDELAPGPWSNLNAEQIEKLAATGFLRMAADPTATGSQDVAEGANQVVADTLKIVGSALLGLTVGCAQCHDHKYDPIPQTDYFRLRAVFEPALDPGRWRRPGQRLVSLYTDADRAKAAEIEAEVQVLQKAYDEKQAGFVAAALEKELLKYPEADRGPLREAYQTKAEKRSPEQKQLLASNPNVNISPGVLYQYNEAAANELKADQAKIAAKRSEKPVEDFVAVANEQQGRVPATRLFHRGDYRQPKQEVQPGDLTIAAPDGERFEIASSPADAASSGRRLAYAKHLMSGSHPLVGRVLVNRIWLHHFGRGLVETPADFGMLGLPPSHPELLDWLAFEFSRNGWRLKELHKSIMLSTVYRQSSAPLAEDRKDELALVWYGRYPLRRLEAEILRDRVLVATGRLDRTLYGPSAPVAEDFVGQVIVKDDVPRRGIYLETRRTRPVSFLTAFDAPVMALNCERRTASNGAMQSLMLMNSDFVLKHARLFAERLRQETPLDFAKELAQPFVARHPRHEDAWQFGYGAYDENAKRVSSFQVLPHFTGSAWQGGESLPDPKLGWVILHASGGHAGNDADHAAIRRWTAPRAGRVTLSGMLKHASENGDGVRGRIVSSRAGLLGEWSVKAREQNTELASLDVQPGDTLDLVTDCQANVNSDSFEWAVRIELVADGEQSPAVWNSSADFRGPRGVSLAQQVAFAWPIAYQRPISPDELDLACRFLAGQLAHLRAAGDKSDHELTALTNLCQQLLSSNEFLYVD